jgi:hypothetical protein
VLPLDEYSLEDMISFNIPSYMSILSKYNLPRLELVAIKCSFDFPSKSYRFFFWISLYVEIYESLDSILDLKFDIYFEFDLSSHRSSDFIYEFDLFGHISSGLYSMSNLSICRSL